MSSARELLEAGHLLEAIEVLNAELRDNPTDSHRRSFLFELLAFAGRYDRAEIQLDILARASTAAEIGATVYRGALRAELEREQMFADGTLPSANAVSSVSGILNGRPFERLEDADPRIGARIEVFAGGRYLWLAFADIASLAVEPPRRLRDLRWAPARLVTGPSARELDLGAVLLPVVTPAAWKHADPEIRLARATDWDELADGDFIPVGQKLLRVDGELIPLLSVRELVMTPAPPASGMSDPSVTPNLTAEPLGVAALGARTSPSLAAHAHRS